MEELIVLFTRYRVTFAQAGQVLNTLERLIPKMKSGRHFCISNIVYVSSLRKKTVLAALLDLCVGDIYLTHLG